MAETPAEVMLIAMKMAGESKSKVCYIYQATPTLSGDGWYLKDVGRVDLTIPLDFSGVRRACRP